MPQQANIVPDQSKLVQGSDEWYQARLGKVTSSCFGKLAGKGRAGGWTQTALTYMNELVAEKITGRPAEQINSKYLDHGNEHEPTARQLYQLHRAKRDPVNQVGFVNHPSIEGCGGSPDALVGDEGVLEIKCPYHIHNHLANIENDGPVDRDYIWQAQGNMWVTGRRWCDFVSFHPFVPESYQFHVVRIFRDEDVIEDLEEKVPRFLEQVSIKLNRMTGLVRLDSEAEAND